jgi:hypothetical protein
MNKKIQELVKQCHRPVLTADKRYLGETFDYEKFAELIVRECMSIVKDKTWGGTDLALATIKEHFGVK